MHDSPRTSVPLLARACLVAGPLLFAASTFFWHDGRYGATGGTIVALSVPVWTYGILALLDRMGTVLPRYAAALRLLALFGVVAGAAFGFQGFFEQVYGMDAAGSLAALEQHPVTAGLLLWWTGPLFPLTLLLLGAGLIRTRQLPLPVGLLICAGAVLFPASRIPRAEWIAHIVDVVLLAPFLIAALRQPRQSAAGPADTSGRRS
ncbi:hypothetical protein [Catellatospora methionotrophica]|uniref:hypothetical protein n=1 Tax=Catellatospora methionotrophica TaxID=121620 RepID=UPI003404113D